MNPIQEATAFRTLVVDDNIDTVESTCELLTAHGFDAQATTSGVVAVRQVHEESLDAVLIDLAMPVMDGFEVARLIRAECGPRGKRPLLVAITGLGPVETADRVREAGFDLHLTKPVEPRILIGVMKRFRRLLT